MNQQQEMSNLYVVVYNSALYMIEVSEDTLLNWVKLS